jgi:spectinomycin phosphotransferase
MADDAERGRVAGLLGDLHRHPRPRHLPVWRPRIGWHPHAGREELESCLAQPGWSGGPWSGPAERLLTDAHAALTRAIRRFLLLGAAVAGSVDRWVVTHGEPHTANLISTPDGPRLVDWGTVCLAPRERDLRETLGRAEGDEPWFAYVAAGGRPEPLSPDTLELFALEWHLSEIAEYAVRFSRPHEDTADDRRCFADLEAEVAALLEGWS